MRSVGRASAPRSEMRPGLPASGRFRAARRRRSDMKRFAISSVALAASVAVAAASAYAASVKVQGDLAPGQLCNYWNGNGGPALGDSTVAIGLRAIGGVHKTQVN